MNPTMLTAAVAVAFNLAAPAVAQTAAAPVQLSLSKGADKPIRELQAAYAAKDPAAVAAKLPLAQAAAKTPDDRHMIAMLQYDAAVTSGDHAAKAAAIEAMIASDSAIARSDRLAYRLQLASAYSAAQQLDRAAATLEQALVENPGNVQATINLAETRNSQNRPGEAVALIQKAIVAKATGGAKPEENWYKRAVAIGHKAKLPVTVEAARQWVAAYPTPTSWRDALLVYRSQAQLDDNLMLDLLRLHRATGTLETEAEYDNLAYGLIKKGLVGEAKTVLDQGSAASKFDRSKAPFREMIAQVNAQIGDDKANLKSAPLAQATSRQTANAGDVHLGYGNTAKAVEFYRAALDKPGADKDLINLHMGAALTEAGDKAGAEAAFKAVGGQRAELAKYWLIYLATKG